VRPKAIIGSFTFRLVTARPRFMAGLYRHCVQVQVTLPESDLPAFTGGAFEKVNEPDPFALTVIDALAAGATAL
jgi:hypothetical protein